MLQSKIISKDACAVSWGPDEIMVRKRGRDYYGKEETLARIQDGKLIINCDVARKFGIIVKCCDQSTYESDLFGPPVRGNRASLPVDRISF